MGYYIAVDIGGTQMRAACIPCEKISPLIAKRISTQGLNATPEDRLVELITTIWPEDQPVAAIGVAVAGWLDAYTGVIIEAPNIPGWGKLPLRQHLEDIFHVPVALGNDANLAALGEWRFGAGINHHHLIYITVSTGIGGGVIMDDRMVLGVRGMAAELGHVTILPDGPMCSCGQRGHLEALASGPSIARWAQEELTKGKPSILPVGSPLTAKDVAIAAGQGDELAKAALARSGSYLGLALANYLHIFNPSIVIIGGGVSKSGPLLFEPMKAALHQYVMSPEYLDNLTLTTAALGDDVCLMGALALACALVPQHASIT